MMVIVSLILFLLFAFGLPLAVLAAMTRKLWKGTL
jgi:hypothetical protein